MKCAAILITAAVLTAGFVFAEEKMPEVKTFRAEAGADGVQRAEIVGGEYFFEPNHIIVKLGIPVELKVRKAGGFIPHDISMNYPEAGMSFKTNFGKSGEAVRFTPTKTGTYLFYCAKKVPFLKSHKERGMEGIIEVIE